MEDNIKFLTKDDLLMLCDEAKKDTQTGKLACISLMSILDLIEKSIDTFDDKIKYYTKETSKWFLFRALGIIMCLVFMPRIPVYHVLFWVNLIFPIIGHIGLRYCRNMNIYYMSKHDKLADLIDMINKALGIEEKDNS